MQSRTNPRDGTGTDAMSLHSPLHRLTVSNPGPRNTSLTEPATPEKELYLYARSFHAAAKKLAGTLELESGTYANFRHLPSRFYVQARPRTSPESARARWGRQFPRHQTRSYLDWQISFRILVGAVRVPDSHRRQMGEARRRSPEKRGRSCDRSSAPRRGRDCGGTIWAWAHSANTSTLRCGLRRTKKWKRTKVGSGRFLALMGCGQAALTKRRAAKNCAPRWKTGFCSACSGKCLFRRFTQST